jgi:hypothetical protein
MKTRLFRPASIVLLIGFGLMSLGFGPRINQGHDQQIDLDSFQWGTTTSQKLRICIVGDLTRKSSGHPTESFRLNVAEIKLHVETGSELLVRELRVPAGEFRCTDFSYEQLVAAGLSPDPTSGALKYLIAITQRSSRGRTDTVDSNEVITIHGQRTEGAVQTIDVISGRIELYERF